MEILKSFFSKFVLLVIIIGCIILVTGNNNQGINGKDLTSQNNIKVKKGSYINPPIQIALDEDPINVTIGGIKVKMKKLAEYDITGVVMETEKYSDVVGPMDVALAWGKLSENENYKDFTSCTLKDRTLSWYSNDGNWLKKMGGVDAVGTYCSNTHLVPASDEIRKQILKIKKDQYIRLTGYLVKLEWTVGSTKRVWGPSSLTRADSGENACEIMYVQTVKNL